jgi:hypothetical protein
MQCEDVTMLSMTDGTAYPDDHTTFDSYLSDYRL